MLNHSRRLKESTNEINMVGSVLMAWEVDIHNSCTIGQVCIWLKPLRGWWALNCDGAMDDSKSGYGGLFRNDVGEPSFAYFGHGTKRHVLWVELQAILRGVSLAIPRG